MTEFFEKSKVTTNLRSTYTEPTNYKSGRYFKLAVATSSLTLLLLCSLTALAQRPNRIPPCGPLTQYQPCTATVWQALGDAINSMEGANAARLAELEVRIEEARQRFFKAYPNGPGRAQAEEEFASLLLEKDMYLCNVDLFNSRQGQIDSGLQFRVGRNIDGGIRPFAIRSFNQWTELIRLKKGREMPNGIPELSNRFRKAFAESQPQYEQYRLARDWAEFAAAGRSITEDPKTYVTLLLAIKRPWGISGTFAEPDLMGKAAEHYLGLTDVFGEDSVSRAAKRLMAAPKNKDGNLTPVLQANGQRFETPYTAFQAMLGDGNPRNYILTAIFEEAGNEQQIGYLREADKRYKHLVAAYGTKAVTDAAEQVRRAEKNEYDFIKDTKALGVQRNRRHHALQDLLSNKDPKGYVRAILAFHDNLTSAPEVDAAYAKLVSAHGERAVVSAGEQLTAFWRAEQFPDLPQEYAPLMRDYTWGNEMRRRDAEGDAQRAPSVVAGGKKSMAGRSGSGMGIYELLMGLLDGSRTLPRAATNADLMDNPAYLTWAKFPLGTKVTYAFRSWSEKGKQIIPGSRTNTNPYRGLIQVYQLKELNSKGGTVELTEKKFFPEGAGQGTSVGQGFAARVLKSQHESPEKPQGVISDSSGTEPLEVNGKTYQCRWRKIVRRQAGVGAGSPEYLVTITTTWESDEVPGGLVLERTETGAQGAISEAGNYVTIVEKIVQPIQIDNLAALTNPPTVFFQIKPDLAPGSSQAATLAKTAPSVSANANEARKKPDDSQRVGNDKIDPKGPAPQPTGGNLPYSPQQEVGTYRANRLNAPAVNISVTFNNGKLLLTVPGQPTYLLENIGGRRYRLVVPGSSGFFVTFRPVKGDGSKTEMLLEQPQGNFVVVKIQ